MSKKLPTLARKTIISTSSLPLDKIFKIRLVRADLDSKAHEDLEAGNYECQHLENDYTAHFCTLGALGDEENARSVASLTLTLASVMDVIRYNPANPPIDEYVAQEMMEAHKESQSDFKGAKKLNLTDFRTYGEESLRGERRANLPEITGWQATKVAAETVFFVLHEIDPCTLYGKLYLRRKAIMQSDGQTQTAMLFQLAGTPLAVKTGAENRFRVKLEVEFGLSADEAAQAFADRNGRGTKKNKNLVSKFTTVGGISTLRKKAVAGTIFEKRLHDGRNQGTGESHVKNIIDLSTLEQLLLLVTTHGDKKPEHIKECHVSTFLPFCSDFFKMLESLFGEEWPETTEEGTDPYRKVKVHGWPFALKAIAGAYHKANYDELGPLADALKVATAQDIEGDTEVGFKAEAAELQKRDPQKYKSVIEAKELKSRLEEIDWNRHREHWTEITGYSTDDEGMPAIRALADGTEVVKPKAPNVSTTISEIEKRILGEEWRGLCKTADFQVKKSKRK